jgi:hypothetical protein
LASSFEICQGQRNTHSVGRMQSLYLAGNTLRLHYKANRLMLFGETVAVYCKNHTEHIDTRCGQNAVFQCVIAGGKCSNRWALKGLNGKSGLPSVVASRKLLVVNWSLSREEVRRMDETVYPAVTSSLTFPFKDPSLPLAFKLVPPGNWNWVSHLNCTLIEARMLRAYGPNHPCNLLVRVHIFTCTSPRYGTTSIP